MNGHPALTSALSDALRAELLEQAREARAARGETAPRQARPAPFGRWLRARRRAAVAHAPCA